MNVIQNLSLGFLLEKEGVFIRIIDSLCSSLFTYL